MKRQLAMVLAMVCAWFLVGCVQTPAAEGPKVIDPNISVSSFSYEIDSGHYTEGTPGVQVSDFVNTSEIEMDLSNVIQRAQRECRISYTDTAVSFDEETGVWRVDFYTEGMAGGGLSVYLDDQGKTVLIVQGE